MNIKFGDDKVAIHAGIDIEGNGCVQFISLFRKNIDKASNYKDVPVNLKFTTIKSIDIVINSLEHVRREMYKDMIRSELNEENK